MVTGPNTKTSGSSWDYNVGPEPWNGTDNALPDPTGWGVIYQDSFGQ